MADAASISDSQTALTEVFGSSITFPTGTTNDNVVAPVSTALRSTSNFRNALGTDGIFSLVTDVVEDDVSGIFAAVPHKLTVKFDYTGRRLHPIWRLVLTSTDRMRRTPTS